ncbi:MAG: hypothetical protein GY950_35480 [bacterium]|nr:hypothetical protein [bacterium]
MGDALHKRFEKLEPLQKENVLLSILFLGKWDISILYNFGAGMRKVDQNELYVKLHSLDLKEKTYIHMTFTDDIWFVSDSRFNIFDEDSQYIAHTQS